MTGSYPAGYDAKGLCPQIILKNKAGTEQYRYEHPNIDNTPTQEFNLVSWFIEAGVNSNHGMAQILIDDRDNDLLDLTKNRRSVKIKNSWEMIINLGKDEAGLEVWFDGIIEEAEIIRPSANLQYILVTAFGWGIRTAHRLAKMSRFQLKNSGGLTLDSSDTNARVSELFKDVFEDDDVPAFRGLGQESITVTGVDTIDIKLPDYQRDFQTYALMLNELAAIPGSLYGVDPTKDAFLRLRGTTFGGYLITNDTENPAVLTTNWDQGKLLIMRNTEYRVKESVIDTGFTVGIGIGAQHDTLDHDQTSANATLDLSSTNYAFEFDPIKDNVRKIALFLSKTGTLVKDLTVSIVGEDSGGGPNEDDIRKRVVIPASRLQSELGSSKYFEILFEKIPVTFGEKLFVFIKKYGDATNYVSIDYQTGSGTYYTSADALTWSSNTGDAKFRTYHSKTMHIIGQNCVARRSHRSKEMPINFQDFPDENTATQAMEGLLDTRGKIKALYSPITVSTPDARPDLGKTVRFKDVFNGKDVSLDMIGYSLGGTAFDKNNMGAVDMVVLVEEWFL